MVGHRIIDAVLEDIRWSLEVPISKFNQRRVSMVKYLAELYNYRMVESAVIFKVFIKFPSISYESLNIHMNIFFFKRRYFTR